MTFLEEIKHAKSNSVLQVEHGIGGKIPPTIDRNGVIKLVKDTRLTKNIKDKLLKEINGITDSMLCAYEYHIVIAVIEYAFHLGIYDVFDTNYTTVTENVSVVVSKGGKMQFYNDIIITPPAISGWVLDLRSHYIGNKNNLDKFNNAIKYITKMDDNLLDHASMIASCYWDQQYTTDLTRSIINPEIVNKMLSGVLEYFPKNNDKLWFYIAEVTIIYIIRHLNETPVEDVPKVAIDILPGLINDGIIGKYSLVSYLARIYRQ